MRHALAVDLDQRNFDNEYLIREEDIVSVCASLISVDSEGKTIRFVHSIVKEYLESDHRNLLITQDYITKVCLTYLQFDAFTIKNETSENIANSLSLHYLLLFYTAEYWGYHASQCSGHSITTYVLDFLEQAPTLAYSIMHTMKYRYGAAGVRTATDVPKLQIASSFGLQDVVKCLLQEDADIDSTSADGWTALSAAAWTGHTAIIELLLERGVNKEIPNDAGWTALAHACRNEHVEIIRKLLANGANIETRTNIGWTPLISAAWHGHVDIVRLLLDNGTDIKASNDGGWNSLHQAAGHGDSAVIQVLLDRGASVQARSIWGWTPLMSVALAKGSGATSAVQLLLQAGSDRAASL